MNTEKAMRLHAILNRLSPAAKKELSARINAYASKFGTDQALDIFLPVLEGVKPCQDAGAPLLASGHTATLF